MQTWADAMDTVRLCIEKLEYKVSLAREIDIYNIELAVLKSVKEGTRISPRHLEQCGPAVRELVEQVKEVAQSTEATSRSPISAEAIKGATISCVVGLSVGAVTKLALDRIPALREMTRLVNAAAVVAASISAFFTYRFTEQKVIPGNESFHRGVKDGHRGS